MPYICQNILPFSPWVSSATRKLPGIQPVKSDGFFLVDEVFHLQMKYREKLLKTNRDEVYFNDFRSEDECRQLLEFILGELKKNKA